jgi:hypothetical protein
MRPAAYLLILTIFASLVTLTSIQAQHSSPELVLIAPQSGIITPDTSNFEATIAPSDPASIAVSMSFSIALDNEKLYQSEDFSAPFCAFGEDSSCAAMPADLALQIADGSASLMVSATTSDGAAATIEQPFTLVIPASDTASQQQSSQSPSIHWNEPAIDGVAITHAQSTFHLKAFDPTVGDGNGEGIRRVEIEIYNAEQARLYRRLEWKPSYCAFGGDDPCQPIADWLLKKLKPNTPYTIKARAIARSGAISPWSSRTFQLVPSNNPDPDPNPQPDEWQIIRPTIIELEDEQLINPLRGFYRWREQEYAPQPGPAPEAYDRFTWREIEPSRGKYDFGPIDKAIAQAERENRRFAFRIRAMVHRQGLAVPDYLISSMAQGWWGDADNNGNSDTYIPDWNDPFFRERLAKLAAALGERYNGDPRIAWVDVGMYGNWGEWHMWPFLDAYPHASGAQKPSEAGKRAIIDAMARAFPDTQLIMGSEEPEALIYALRTYPQMGWRRDSLGDVLFTTSAGWRKLSQNPEHWKLVTERWKSAPIISEFISPDDQRDPDVYQLALAQATEYHVSLISNGNTLSWGGLGRAGRESMLALAKAVGYRYELQQLTVPATLTAGKPFAIITEWDNAGNAPTYEQWKIRYELRDTSGVVRWQQESALDLRTVMPETEQISVVDSLTLSSDLRPGTYTLAIRVEDPQNQRPFMRLAIDGGHSGRYDLTTLTIR